MSRGRRHKGADEGTLPLPVRAGDSLAVLEQLLGYSFKAREHLERSLVHRSYLNESALPPAASNERLEFLGDAVLELVVTRYLFRRFPDAPEGQLTQLRASIVRSEGLSPVGDRLQLGHFMQMGRGEQATGGRRRPLNLARAFEAVVGAVFVDSSFHVTERWLLRILKDELAGATPEADVLDAKSRLQQRAQAERGVLPIYRTVEVSGPPHARRFHVQVLLGDEAAGHGEGLSKQAAEQQAAAAALAILA
jgi:ribonuclease III